MTPIEAAAKALWEEESPVLGLPQPWDEQSDETKQEYRDAAKRTVRAFLEASEPLWEQKWKCADDRGCAELATLLVQFEDERMPVCYEHYGADDVLVGLAFERTVTP